MEIWLFDSATDGLRTIFFSVIIGCFIVFSILYVYDRIRNKRKPKS
jgi:hypothetical protein